MRKTRYERLREFLVAINELEDALSIADEAHIDSVLDDLRQQLYGFLMHEPRSDLRNRMEYFFTGLDQMARRTLQGERFAEDWLTEEKERLHAEIRLAQA